MGRRLTAAEGPLAENSRGVRVGQLQLELELEREQQEVLLTQEELAVQVLQPVQEELQVVQPVQEQVVQPAQEELVRLVLQEVRLEELAVQQDLEARRQVEPKDENSVYFCHERPADPEIFLSLIVFASLHVSTAFNFLPA
jgi:hypothetical protein